MLHMNVLLISTYELGRQPFGLASPAAWLHAAGAKVTCLDLALTALDAEHVAAADFIGFYLPMHTATRIAVPLIKRVQQINARAHLCCYGLYAPLNAEYLQGLGVQTILGGEFEHALVQLMETLHMQKQQRTTAIPLVAPPQVSHARQRFQTPLRMGLPALDQYAVVAVAPGEQRTVGYTEATRGCKHTCRHCPIVPVYGGKFRVVQREVVLADIRNQVAAGAEHITFGDPDFFNGPGHALPIVEALHAEFPDLTYDVTIKVEHLRKHAALLPTLRDTGCLFVTSAVEAVDDEILRLLDKGHSRADFVAAVADLRAVGLPLNPTFVAFNPWISVAGYHSLLQTIAELDLIEHVAPIQYAIRLLITAQSPLLTLPSIQALVHPFDEAALVYPWQHPDPQVDALQAQMIGQVEALEKRGATRRAIFDAVWALTLDALAMAPAAVAQQQRWMEAVVAREHARFVPRLSEPWYC